MALTSHDPSPIGNLDLNAELRCSVPRQLDSLAIPKAAYLQISNEASRWLQTIPSISKFDHVILNHFINLFVQEVVPTFKSFHDFEIRQFTSEEETLAIAAVGGLYSDIAGSDIIARAMLSDLRRLLLTLVISPG